MLGPPLETYKPNKGVLIALAIGLILALLIQKDIKGGWLLALCGPFVLALGWVLSVRVSLHQEGISYQSFLGSKEMRWDEVERFYYSATKQSINFIPIGTYYTFKLVDSRGQKISFGNRVERRAELGTKLLQCTFDPLLRKLASLFNAGSELDFGPIRVIRDKGVKIKRLFGYKEIPWDQVADYRIDQGQFYVWRVGQKRTTGTPISSIPNAFVLLALLDNIFRPSNEAKSAV